MAGSGPDVHFRPLLTTVSVTCFHVRCDTWRNRLVIVAPSSTSGYLATPILYPAVVQLSLNHSNSFIRILTHEHTQTCARPNNWPKQWSDIEQNVWLFWFGFCCTIFQVIINLFSLASGQSVIRDRTGRMRRLIFYNSQVFGCPHSRRGPPVNTSVVFSGSERITSVQQVLFGFRCLWAFIVHWTMLFLFAVNGESTIIVMTVASTVIQCIHSLI